MGCSLPNSMSKVEVHQTFNTAFYKLLNAIGDICERTCSSSAVLGG